MEKLSSTFDLIQILDHLPQSKVLCIGDVMLDRYVYGSIDRISPEAPIPVMQYQRDVSMLGGVGNVARNLCAWRCETVMLAVTGQDDAANEIKALAKELPHLAAELLSDPARPTTLKTRYVSGNQQMLRLDHESKESIRDLQVEQAMQKIKQILPRMGAVILSDYAKGMLSDKLVEAVIREARAHKVPVLVDPKGQDYGRYKGATILSPNLKELAQGTNRVLKTDEEIVDAAKFLIQKLDLEALLVTRSKDGMSLVQKGGAVHHLPAEARDVYDVSGAGDTSIAMLAAAIAAKASFIDAAYMANIAAGIAVGKLGTAIVMTSEIDEALLSSHNRMKSKLYDTPALLDRIAVWRHQGYKIGFTNGCFDLIHPGHISLLRQSRAACDRLVVAMNTDASVKKLKGDNRPIQNQQSRATVMSSLDSVDAVVLFDEDTPMKLIEAIKPDVLVKGADYTVATVVGSDFVQSYGGKILLAKLEEGFSTTNTVKKIAAG